jgi:hypothetical protein
MQIETRRIRLALLSLGLVGLMSQPDLLGHRPVFQTPPQTESDIPSGQLFEITRLPPQEWRLEGLIASSDFGRLLLRHQRAHIERLDQVMWAARDYRPEWFDDWNSPQVVKVEIGEGAIRVLQAPKELVMTSRQRYLFPLLVKSNLSEPTLLTVESPWKIYRLAIPEKSVRGFCLNIRPGKVGKTAGPLLFTANGQEAHWDLTADIRAKGRLSVKLIDSDGQPLAARVYLSGSDQLAYMPQGATQRIMPRTGEYYFYARGSFEVALPEGEATVEAVTGLEYASVRKSVQISAAKPTEIELKPDHQFPLYKEQWYSADSHIHANYSPNEVVTLDDISLQIAGEGLDIANLMVANSSGELVHDIHFFEGRPNSISRDRKILYWNEEMRNRLMYGHMSFFNLKELVYPIYTGFPNTPYYEDYPPNYAQAKKAKEQNGVVTYVHPAAGNTFDRVGYGGAQEFPVDIILGQVDALDVLSNTVEPPAVELWYRTLNCGLHCAISAGTDSFTNLMMYLLPGTQRVYVHVPGEFSYQKWIDNYRQGISFATNGPILDFRANGQLPGTDLQFTGRNAKIHVRAEVRSMVPVDKLEIVVNGSVVISEPVADKQSHVIERDLSLDRSSWVAARVWGPPHRLIPDDPQAFAHSGPVYCRLSDGVIASSTDALFWVDWIDQLMARVKDKGVFATSERRDSVIQLFSEAQAKYRRLAQPGNGGSSVSPSGR